MLHTKPKIPNSQNSKPQFNKLTKRKFTLANSKHIYVQTEKTKITKPRHPQASNAKSKKKSPISSRKNNLNYPLTAINSKIEKKQKKKRRNIIYLPMTNTRERTRDEK